MYAIEHAHNIVGFYFGKCMAIKKAKFDKNFPSKIKLLWNHVKLQS